MDGAPLLGRGPRAGARARESEARLLLRRVNESCPHRRFQAHFRTPLAEVASWA